MLDGYTRVCGLIGNPVEHTLSPAIHNFLASRLGDNLVYVPFRVSEGMVGDAVRGAYALNLLGCNVTVPYKSEVLPFLKEVDGLAGRIGAVNTLVRTQGGFKGYNTDMPGLYRAFCSDRVKVKGESALILGAGGVARAVAMLLMEKGAGRIVLMNRTVERAEAIAGEINALAGRPLASAMPLSEYHSLPEGERFLAIQATSVGMFPQMEEAVVEDGAFYDKIHTGYDLIFNPPQTRFLRLVEEHGGRWYNGAKMLLYQGIIAYELWTGQSVSEELAEEACEALLQNEKPEGGLKEKS